MTTKTVEACDCGECRRLCARNPGWFTPVEARSALDAGHAAKLMRDWLEPCDEVGNDDRIYLLSPASIGHEGDDAPEMDFFHWLSGGCKGACVFYREGLCDLHATTFKPVQCRTAFGCRDLTPEYPDNYEVARLWDTDEGRAVVSAWQRALPK